MICIHGAKSTTVLKSKRNLAVKVRNTADREGWAYATELSGPGVRVVIEASRAPGMKVGQTHMALDCYEQLA